MSPFDEGHVAIETLPATYATCLKASTEARQRHSEVQDDRAYALQVLWMRSTGSSHGWSTWSPALCRKARAPGVSLKGGLCPEEAALERAALQASPQSRCTCMSPSETSIQHLGPQHWTLRV